MIVNSFQKQLQKPTLRCESSTFQTKLDFKNFVAKISNLKLKSGNVEFIGMTLEE